MTPRQIELVKASFAKVQPIAPQAAQMFYRRLFEIAPDVAPLFKGDMQEQGRRLMQMIGAAVAGLDRVPDLLPVLQDLGHRHVAYGVKPAHYESVGEALLWTLEQGLGDAFTPEVRDAWVAVYTALADAMKQAAAGREPIPA